MLRAPAWMTLLTGFSALACEAPRSESATTTPSATTVMIPEPKPSTEMSLEQLISGTPSLPRLAVEAFRAADQEERKAYSPRVYLEEGLPETVSLRNHLKCAIDSYETGIASLGSDHQAVARATRKRISVLRTTLSLVSPLAAGDAASSLEHR